jgi:dCTP deaminase
VKRINSIHQNKIIHDMSILGKSRLKSALSENDVTKRLFVTPLLSDTQIGTASIDIRIGGEFIAVRRGNLPYLDVGGNTLTKSQRGRYEHKHYIERGEPFYLHPQELVLASTVEYFRLPADLGGYVTSRSSWGRAGLVIATAVAVHAGFRGTITLELVNVGEVPLVLYPGLSVAQLVLFDCDGADQYAGGFNTQISPRSVKAQTIGESKDIQFWCPPKLPR